MFLLFAKSFRTKFIFFLVIFQFTFFDLAGQNEAQKPHRVTPQAWPIELSSDQNLTERPDSIGQAAWMHFLSELKYGIYDSVDIWNNPGAGDYYIGRERYEYDSSHRLIQTITSRNVEGVIVPYDKYTYAYDTATGYVSTREEFLYLSGEQAYKPSCRQIFKYDSHGNNVLSLNEIQEEGFWILTEGDSMIFDYNAENRPIRECHFNYNYRKLRWQVYHYLIVDSLGSDGESACETLYDYTEDGAESPMLRFHDIKWGRPFRNVNVDNKYIMSRIWAVPTGTGTWLDSVFMVASLNAKGEIDSLINYDFITPRKMAEADTFDCDKLKTLITFLLKDNKKVARDKEIYRYESGERIYEMEYFYDHGLWTVVSGGEKKNKVDPYKLQNIITTREFSMDPERGTGKWTDIEKRIYY